MTRPSANGSRYEGEFREGRRHGHGTFTWQDGDRYEGEFEFDRPDGQGTFLSGGKKYSGNWVGGCFRNADQRTALFRPLKECP